MIENDIMDKISYDGMQIDSLIDDVKDIINRLDGAWSLRSAESVIGNTEWLVEYATDLHNKIKSFRDKYDEVE